MMKVQHCWFLPDFHMKQVCQQAAESKTGWDKDDFLRHTLSLKGVCFVAENVHGEVVGTACWSLYCGCFELQYLCVGARYRRGGVARQMVERLQDKCRARERGRVAVVVDVEEDNLVGQLFFRSMGFTARRPTARDKAMGVLHFTWLTAGSENVPVEDPGAWDFNWVAEVMEGRE